MGNTSGAKYKHFLYNPNRVKTKSGDKHKNAIDSYVNLLKKEAKEGETKWVLKTKEKSLLKLRRYRITNDQIKETLKSKGLDDLVKLCK